MEEGAEVGVKRVRVCSPEVRWEGAGRRQARCNINVPGRDFRCTQGSSFGTIPRKRIHMIGFSCRKVLMGTMERAVGSRVTLVTYGRHESGLNKVNGKSRRGRALRGM